jgi:hypothetical protein
MQWKIVRLLMLLLLRWARRQLWQLARRPLWRRARRRAAALSRVLVRRLATRLARRLSAVIAASSVRDRRAARNLSAWLLTVSRTPDMH